MGAFDKQKAEIQRDLKQQKSDLAKAKKLAEDLLHQLKEVERRLTLTEQVVNDIPDSEINTAYKLICDSKTSPPIKDQMLQLAQFVINTTPAKQTSIPKSKKASAKNKKARSTQDVSSDGVEHMDED